MLLKHLSRYINDICYLKLPYNAILFRLHQYTCRPLAACFTCVVKFEYLLINKYLSIRQFFVRNVIKLVFYCTYFNPLCCNMCVLCSLCNNIVQVSSLCCESQQTANTWNYEEALRHLQQFQVERFRYGTVYCCYK